ncbi:DNA-binding NarL/FixJ family response regulator [Lutibacter sp. Hel_I_33_5]|uniref:response regulator transcription factor n=1 Tax=Lutibacter sp. Hel_I_33_5 TaxID=1566289 RepID=UPI0011ACADAB|nr:response regulator transcription factor [Lutibacter sp. Hel_I_33_5]TVZ56408.1 DNA-binding NarL/FixJ family response regulator [Lutibacter sp. Hel_I_33_5]
MKKKIRVLFSDDHAVILKGLIAMAEEITSFDLEIISKTTCDGAYETILFSEKKNPYDVFFTDLSYNNQHGRLKSGEDLITAVRKIAPNLKIGVITGHSETNRVYNVIKNQNPDAYILKDDCNSEELNFAIQQMLNGQNYYTHLVHQKILKRSIVQISMDDIALQILKELPKHHKLSNMVGHILKSDGNPLKIRSIENKLSDLRLDLNAQNNTDLVLKAKELGIID